MLRVLVGQKELTGTRTALGEVMDFAVREQSLRGNGPLLWEEAIRRQQVTNQGPVASSATKRCNFPLGNGACSCLQGVRQPALPFQETRA